MTGEVKILVLDGASPIREILNEYLCDSGNDAQSAETV